MSDFATEGGHFYLPDGTPFYTVVGKNGKERNATLRDARPLKAVPGATGVIKCAAAPGLEIWKRNQVLLSAMTLPRIEGESSDAFIERVEYDWREQGKQAALMGEAIHASIEKYYRGTPSANYFDFVMAADAQLADACGIQSWKTERSFACTAGFGGKIDLHSDEWVIDIKTKDTLEGVTLYDEHLMQLAAYRFGLGGNLRSGILFVCRAAPAACFLEASKDDLDKGEAMFFSLLSFWRAKNRYAP